MIARESCQESVEDVLSKGGGEWCIGVEDEVMQLRERKSKRDKASFSS
jgi:hypothetical protein